MTGLGTRLPHIDGFENLRQIGRGGSALVFQATQTSLNREVALKVLHLPGFDERARRLFDIERQTLVGLSDSSQYIVSVYDGGFTDEGDPYLAMQLCPGGSLAALVASDGPLDTILAIRVALRVALALEVAHRGLLVHGDVKPENVLISANGDPILSDFGIATVMGQDTVTGEGFSPFHVAPEILKSFAPTTASDFYSLGSTLFSLLTGHSPVQRFVGEPLTTNESLSRVRLDPSGELPAAFVCPKSVRILVRSLLVKDPDRRPRHGPDIVATLRSIERELGTIEHDLALPVRSHKSFDDGEAPIGRASSQLPSPKDTGELGSKQAETNEVSIDPFATLHVSRPVASSSVRPPSSLERHSATTKDPVAVRSASQDGSTGDGTMLNSVRPSAPVRGANNAAHARVSAPADTEEISDDPSEVSKISRQNIGKAIAVLVALLISAVVVTRMVQGRERKDVGDTAVVVPVTEVEVIVLRAPEVLTSRAINNNQVEVVWTDRTSGAVFDVEYTRANDSSDLAGSVRNVPAGSTSVVVESLDVAAWTPCFVVVARDPGTGRVERGRSTCLEVAVPVGSSLPPTETDSAITVAGIQDTQEIVSPNS
jgi:serine/threonine protein kinase